MVLGRKICVSTIYNRLYRARVHYQRHSISHHAISSETTKPYYITTPIFYPNSLPHIGHLHSLVIADIFARHARLVSPQRPVYFITGTDEHGLKIQKAAKDQNMPPHELCNRLSFVFYKLAKEAGISFTKFVRTSMSEHRLGVQHLWNELSRRGFIYKGRHSGWYSISDECFFTESQVSARIDGQTGDKYMVADETGNRVEWTEEVNYKFALSKFHQKLLEYFESNPEAIYPPLQYQQIINVLSSDSSSLPDLSISRPSSRLSWGISVPGDDSHTIYVWLDALTSYLTGVGYPWTSQTDNGTRSGWPPNVQIIGKDILRFHALYFPAFLMALEMPLPQALISHSHWTVNQSKMSKSIGNVVDPFHEMRNYGVDTVRWYLARVGGRFKDDIDWSTEQLEKHELEVRSLLGNFLLRIQSQKLLSRLPPEAKRVPLEHSILFSDGARRPGDGMKDSLMTLRDRVDRHLNRYQVADAVQAIVECLTLANKEVTVHAPWSASTPIDTAIIVQTWSRETLRVCGILLQPFMPTKAHELLDALSVSLSERTWDYAEVGRGERDPGELKSVTLFPSAKKRQELEVERDHAGTALSAEYHSHWWQKVHKTSKRKRKSNNLYSPITKQGLPHKFKLPWRGSRDD